MRVILAFLLATVQFASAAPPAPSPKTVADWASFSKPVVLASQEIKRGDYFRWGKPIWVMSYEAKKQSLVSYVIAIYERGTYLAENRPKLEGNILKRAKEIEGTEESKRIRVETRPDGRKVFFTVMGFGPGGHSLVASLRFRTATLWSCRYSITRTTHPTTRRSKSRQGQPRNCPAFSKGSSNISKPRNDA